MPSGNELTLQFLGQQLPLVSEAVANSATSWILGGALAASGLVATTFMKNAGKVEGLRWWTTRISLEKYNQLPEDIRLDPLEALYYGVDAVRDRRRRETALVRLALGLALAMGFSSAFQLSELSASTRSWNAWLFIGEVLVLPFCVYFFAVLAYACVKHGLPDKEDKQVVEKLISELRASTSTAAVGGELAPRRISSPDSIVQRSPEPYREIIADRMRACHQRFDAQVFKHERECVEYLRESLRALRRDSENRERYDLLALCLDKTLDAFYVEEYLKENCAAARAGLYIARVFVTDSSDKVSLKRIERWVTEQSRAGVRAYTIDRADLQAYMSSGYSSDIFGFTVIRGVESMERVMLHAGVGGSVTAAAYVAPSLVEHFAGIHCAIRERATRVRPERPARLHDPTRTKIVLNLNGEILEGVRLEYVDCNGRPAPMSLAVRCKWNPEQFVRGSIVGVSVPAWNLESAQMRITHAHKFDHTVCKRREHAICFRAREGDCIIGVC